MSFDSSRIRRSQITDSREHRDLHWRPGGFFVARELGASDCVPRSMTSGASPHRWIIPGGTSRVSARSLAVDRPRPRARFARRSPAWLLFTLNGRFGSDPAVRFAFVRTAANGAIQPSSVVSTTGRICPEVDLRERAQDRPDRVESRLSANSA